MDNFRAIFEIALLPFTIGFYFLISFKTNKSIREEVNSNFIERNYFDLLFERTPFIFMILLFLQQLVSQLPYTNLQENILLSMVSLYLLNYTEASITDPLTHKINRHSLRYSYLLNLVFLYFLIDDFSSDKTYSLIALASLMFALIVLFFVVTGVGPSDFRCFFITIPTYFVLFGKDYGLIVILLTMFYVSIYQFLIQRKIGKVPIPVGDIILQPLPYLAIISISMQWVRLLN